MPATIIGPFRPSQDFEGLTIPKPTVSFILLLSQIPLTRHRYEGWNEYDWTTDGQDDQSLHRSCDHWNPVKTVGWPASIRKDEDTRRKTFHFPSFHKR